MPAAIHKLKRTKNSKKELSSKPTFHDSICTEPDTSDDFFFTTSSRRIRFSASVSEHVVPTIDDYSEDEIKKTWYSKADKAIMNKKHDKMVRRYESGKRLKEGMTYRGLDAWTDKGFNKFEAAMDRLIKLVMDEQEDQWLKHANDPDRIAACARSVSKRSIVQALKYAEQDEIEAQEAYKGDFKEELGSEDEDSTGTLSKMVAKKRHSRRRSSATKDRKEKSDGTKERKSKRKSSSKKKVDQ